MYRFIAPAFVVFIALVAFAFRLIVPSIEEVTDREPHLHQFVPTSMEGWEVRDLELGPNEFLVEQSERILRFDEFIYREFKRGNITFSVYISYWSPGKMPVRDVSTHTPDRCWTENGWHCTDMVFRKELEVMGEPLKPAEWRIFEDPQGTDVYVLFWHLVDGEIYDFGGRFNAIPSPSLWVKDVFRQAFIGSPEQYFIRLTANQPFEDFWYEQGFIEVLQGIRKLGLKPELDSPVAGDA